MNDMVEEILKGCDTKLQFGPRSSSKSTKAFALVKITQQGDFKVPYNKMGKRERKNVEVNDIIHLLLSDERVKAIAKQCLRSNPQMVDKARVEIIDCSQLRKVINS